MYDHQAINTKIIRSDLASHKPITFQPSGDSFSSLEITPHERPEPLSRHPPPIGKSIISPRLPRTRPCIRAQRPPQLLLSTGTRGHFDSCRVFPSGWRGLLGGANQGREGGLRRFFFYSRASLEMSRRRRLRSSRAKRAHGDEPLKSFSTTKGRVLARRPSSSPCLSPPSDSR